MAYRIPTDTQLRLYALLIMEANQPDRDKQNWTSKAIEYSNILKSEGTSPEFLDGFKRAVTLLEVLEPETPITQNWPMPFNKEAQICITLSESDYLEVRDAISSSSSKCLIRSLKDDYEHANGARLRHHQLDRIKGHFDDHYKNFIQAKMKWRKNLPEIS